METNTTLQLPIKVVEILRKRRRDKKSKSVKSQSSWFFFFLVVVFFCRESQPVLAFRLSTLSVDAEERAHDAL